MKYAISFLFKFIMTTTILWIVLGLFFNVSLGDILLTSIIFSAGAYLGDVFILPNVDNFWAVLGDFGLAFVGIYVLGFWLFEPQVSLDDASLFSALFIALSEIFYHRYMKQQIIREKVIDTPRKTITSTRMQTEFSKELNESEDD